jgi:DNA-binding transcriptional ArsR family regulator
MTNVNRTLALLANPTRRALLEALRRGPQNVGALQAKVSVSQPAVSQHLKQLKAAGLVRDKVQGATRVYSLDPAGLGPLRAWLDQMWGDQLSAFAREFENDKDSE